MILFRFYCVIAIESEFSVVGDKKIHEVAMSLGRRLELPATYHFSRPSLLDEKPPAHTVQLCSGRLERTGEHTGAEGPVMGSERGRVGSAKQMPGGIIVMCLLSEKLMKF